MNRATALLLAMSLAVMSHIAAAQGTVDQGAQMEVLSVFAPGNGGNFTGGTRPPAFEDQMALYRDLPQHLAELGESDLRKYFKPAAFDVAPADVASTETPRPGVR